MENDSKLIKEKRNVYLDIVKYVTIFLVLWGHVVQQSFLYNSAGVLIEDGNPNLDGIYKLIYTTHMPLFMGLCGYFFSQSIRRHKDYVHNSNFAHPKQACSNAWQGNVTY